MEFAALVGVWAAVCAVSGIGLYDLFRGGEWESQRMRRRAGEWSGFVEGYEREVFREIIDAWMNGNEKWILPEVVVKTEGRWDW